MVTSIGYELLTMTYKNAEQFLYSLSNLPRAEYMTGPTHTHAYLARVQEMLDILGNPERNVPHYIHITGTSGKGSTAEMMSRIISASGLTAGMYSSPHYSHLTERWQVDGRPMSKKMFVEIVEALKPAINEYLQTSSHGMLSFFDLTVVIALLYFAKMDVHYAVMEVGCGGRFDATNVIPHKDVAIITNIGLDHADIIGPTLSDIATEKAGIITANTELAITTERRPKMRKIIMHEAEKSSATYQYLSDTDIATLTADLPVPGLGTHQAKNAALAVTAAKSLGFGQDAIAAGLMSTTLPCKVELVSDRPAIFLDGAHNEDKMKSTVAAIATWQKANRPKAKIHLLVGFSNNKSVQNMMTSLAGLDPTSITCTRNTMNSFRKVANPGHLAEIAKDLAPKATISVHVDPQAALQEGLKLAKKSDILLITGSIFLAGELRPYLTWVHIIGTVE